MYVANFFGNTVSATSRLTTAYSDGCNGAVDNGCQMGICTITNTYGGPA
jgi:hypothetical protein